MVTGLLDTAIVVDLLRSHAPAQEWLARQENLGVSPIVWLEIIEDSKNLRAQGQAIRLLRHFERIELAPADAEWGIRQALRFRLSHNVDALDCLIASSSYRLNVPLYTHNLKHFVPMVGDLAQRPY
jgi:predicted nucleic acid-binding protein